MASAANVLRWVDLCREGDRCVCMCVCVSEGKIEKEREDGGEGAQSARSAQVELH